MRGLRRAGQALFGATVLASAACGQGPGQASEEASESQQQASITISTGSSEICEISSANPGAANSLGGLGMTGGDLGIPVYDGTQTWLFFGDTNTSGPAWSHGADATGYFLGNNASTGLCGGLQLTTSSGVFDPDPVQSPDVCQIIRGGRFPLWFCSYEAIGDYVFQNTVTPPVLPVGTPLPPFSAIPGTDEVPTGAFAYGGEIYEFYQGAPWWSTIIKPYLPVGSLSYLTAWTPTKSDGSPPEPRRIISKVDYNLQNHSGPSAGQNGLPPSAGTPPVPPGWRTPAPLGQDFVQIAPVVDGSTLYLFGTGTYRMSGVHVAQMPLPTGGATMESTVAPYLADTAGFQVWTGSAWAAPPAAAGALTFPDDAVADAGELSVQYFANPGLWVMMYSPSFVSGSAFAGDIVARYATSPTGPWSSATILNSSASLYAPYMLPTLSLTNFVNTGYYTTTSYAGTYTVSSFGSTPGTAYGNQLMSFGVTISVPHIIFCPACTPNVALQ